MNTRSVLALGVCALLCACLPPRQPSPQELQAKRFDAVADKAVVYLFRDALDFSRAPTSVMLDGNPVGTSFEATFFRFELAPGRHRLAGLAGDAGRLEFSVGAGRLYFFRHTVQRFFAFDQSTFLPVAPEQGRAVVWRSELVGGGY